MQTDFKHHLQAYTDSDLETFKKILEEEFIDRMVLQRLHNVLNADFPGDSLPYPRVSLPELDDELDEISKSISWKKLFDPHFC
jgi:hypothetical protein